MSERGTLDGPPDVPVEDSRARWGPETAKAVENFPVSGEPVPLRVIHWLARIKAAAARVNAELGLLDPELAGRIAAAADEVAAGRHDRQFPVDVFQTGSGTSTNMNANEVIASLASDRVVTDGDSGDGDSGDGDSGDGDAGDGAGGEGVPVTVHPNDHVNLGQSSNDVFPSAVHLAVLDAVVRGLIPAMEVLAGSLAAKAVEFDDVVKPGRTHLMDAVPVTLGQEFAGYAAQIRLGVDRVTGTWERLGRIPLGGTATGTGLNTHVEFAERVRSRLVAASGLPISAPADPFEAQGARDALVEVSGALRVVAVSLTKIVNDLRWMASGPRTGLGEIRLPELQKGSSIMPGKVNPVIPEVVAQVAAQVIGNDAAIAFAGSQGNFELNVMVPVMARNLLDSVEVLTSACSLLASRCVDGIEADRDRCATLAELTLATATALNPVIGYDRATEIVRDAAATGRSLRDVARDHGVPDDVLDEALHLLQIARPHG